MKQSAMLNKFMYWINERHQIYLNRIEGKKWPWTKDKILQTYKFTNVFRQLDAVTQVWTNYYIEHADRNATEVFRNLVTFRMFNWPDTFEYLGGWKKRFNSVKDEKDMKQLLKHRHGKIFTGAYIITNNGSTRSKVDLVVESICTMHRDAASIVKEIRKYNTIEHAVEVLQRYPMVGKFIAYEIATDLRHTYILQDATDTHTWANPGPGAKRGLNRIFGRRLKFTQSDKAFILEMEALLQYANDKRKPHVPPLEMRDIEHSLCEFDKYMRVYTGEGRPRSKYSPEK